MTTRDVHPLDEIFTHVADEDGTQTTYNVTALYTHILAHALDDDPAVQRVAVPVDLEHAAYCIERRGVEDDRIKALVAHPEWLKKPVVFIALDDGSHLLVDGTHRYVVYYYGKAEVIPAYIVPEAMAAPFIITDMPTSSEDELMAWSGLSVLRQLLGVKD